MSGRYDTGGSYQPLSPNFANFQVLAIPPANPGKGRSYFDTTLGVGVYANSTWNYASGGGGAITSVFGRTGVIVSANGDYTFAQIGSTPTTILGYGITDAVSLTGTQILTNKTLASPVLNTPNIGAASAASITASGFAIFGMNIAAPSATLSNSLVITGEPLTTSQYAGKTMIMIGTSITFGTGASDGAHKFSTLVNTWLGSTESNFGISSSVLEKRTPLNPLGGTNLLDRLSADMPTYNSSTHGVMVIEMGMNDYGYTGANYTTANYITDYNTAIDFAVAQGWPLTRILLLSPGYVTDTSFTFYSGLSGLAAPTRARMLSFVAATATVATSRGTLYIDMYNAMLNGGAGNLLGTTDGVHPNNSGHAFMAATITQFLGGVVATNPSITMGNTTGGSTATPAFIDLGGTFAASLGQPTTCKLILYHDNTPPNTTGLGISSGHFEHHMFSGGVYDFYINGVLNATIGSKSLSLPGTTSGTTTLSAPAIAGSGAVTLPVSGTLISNVASGTISNQATLDINFSTYVAQFSMIEILLTGVVPATSAAILEARLSTDGTTFITSGYKWDFMYTLAGGTPGGVDDGSATDTTTIHLTGTSSNTAARSIFAVIRIALPNSTSFEPNVQFTSTRYTDAPSTAVSTGFGTIATAQATKGIRFLFSSGNISTATYRVIGYA